MLAYSAGLPKRLGKGTDAASASLTLSGAPIISGVSKIPGMMVLTRTPSPDRSEEHTSELQSLMRISYAVFCLKKKTQTVHLTQHALTIHVQMTSALTCW